MRIIVILVLYKVNKPFLKDMQISYFYSMAFIINIFSNRLLMISIRFIRLRHDEWNSAIVNLLNTDICYDYYQFVI